MLFDVNTGRVLWERKPTQVVPIASLTKMMTALVVVAHARPSAKVMITQDALDYTGSGVGLLPKGKHVPLMPCSTACCCRRATTRRSRSPTTSPGPSRTSSSS